MIVLLVCQEKMNFRTMMPWIKSHWYLFLATFVVLLYSTSRVKCLNDYLVNCQELWCRHSWCPDDESYWLWWCPDLSSGATYGSTLTQQANMLKITQRFVVWIQGAGTYLRCYSWSGKPSWSVCRRTSVWRASCVAAVGSKSAHWVQKWNEGSCG